MDGGFGRSALRRAVEGGSEGTLMATLIRQGGCSDPRKSLHNKIVELDRSGQLARRVAETAKGAKD
jgi:hypothetical protein